MVTSADALRPSARAAQDDLPHAIPEARPPAAHRAPCEKAPSGVSAPAIRCGFIFNHDQLHQVAHSAPIALELMRLDRRVEVSLLATTVPLYEHLQRVLTQHRFPADNLHLIRLPPSWRRVAAMLDPLIPFSRVTTLLVNRKRFGELDVLVTPEKTSLLLRSIGKLKELKFIHTRHGAGDRGVGFDHHSGQFDLVLMSGEKIRDRLRESGALKDDGYAIVGYPKFDLCTPLSCRTRLFDNDLPTVLYNPHCSPRLSSWYRYGLDVLEAFHRSEKYNLIFAPHVMLFRKRLQISLDPLSLNRPGQIPEPYSRNPRILIDLGSPRGSDMTYTESADAYLGDVSSQVYEFLRRPRACLFIDAHRTDWRKDANYRHWSNGPVISNVRELIPAIDDAFTTHPDYLETQRRLFAYSIDVRETPSSQRAAQSILHFIERTCGH